MGFQIGTAGVSTVLVLLSSISLLMHGRWDYVDERYDHEGYKLSFKTKDWMTWNAF